MIPKVAHFYWGRNRPLSWLEYFGVRSFAHYNPDWTIKVWFTDAGERRIPSNWTQQRVMTGAQSHADWFDALADFSTMQPLDHAAVGVRHRTPEVMKADMLRWWLLSTEGGLWSDMDIVYIAPMTALNLDDSAPLWLCLQRGAGRWQKVYPIAFLLAAPGNRFMSDVLTEARKMIKPRAYESAGRQALEGVIARGCRGATAHYLPPECVYPVISSASRRLFENDPLPLAPWSIGMHWFASSPRLPEYIPIITPENIADYDAVLLQHVQRVFNEMQSQTAGATNAKGAM